MSQSARVLLFIAICLASVGVAGALYVIRADERAKGIEKGTIPF
jgi:hypothetical protein